MWPDSLEHPIDFVLYGYLNNMVDLSKNTKKISLVLGLEQIKIKHLPCDFDMCFSQPSGSLSVDILCLLTILQTTLEIYFDFVLILLDWFSNELNASVCGIDLKYTCLAGLSGAQLETNEERAK